MKNYDEISHEKDIITKEYLTGTHVSFSDTLGLDAVDVQAAIEAIYQMAAIAMSASAFDGGNPLEAGKMIIDGGIIK